MSAIDTSDKALFGDMAEIAQIGGWRLEIGTGCVVWTPRMRTIHEVADDFAPDLEKTLGFYPCETDPTIRDRVQAAIDHGTPWDVELPLVTAKGNRLWVRSIGRRQRDGAKTAALVGTVQDVTAARTERMALVQSLNEANQAESNLSAYHTALDQHAIVAMTDRRGKIIHVNERFCEISGYAREELLGQNHRIINSGHHPHEFFVDMWRTIGRGGVWRAEICNRAKDGGLYWVDTTIVPICDANGRPKRYVSLRYDITERLAYEKELETRRIEAEAATIAKSQFLANMSHEIRTPLNGVLGVLDLLLETKQNAEQSDLATRAKAAASDLLTIIDDILDYSKLEAGRIELDNTTFSISKVVDDVVSLLGSLAAERALRLNVALPDDMPDWLVGDPIRLRQILFNLIGNAIKFTETGGIGIDVAYRHEGGGAVELRFLIRDTGIGVSEAAQAKLFTRFNQADNTTTRKFGGTGLGLAISKQLAELMGGAIGVESVVGKGSTFWFSIRCAIGTAPESKPCGPFVKQRVTLPAGFRFLVAEDNAANQFFIVRLLEKHGHKVDVANNGVEAVDAARRSQYDAILMDVQMPEMDGPTAARAIRGLPGPACRTPIVAVTANAMTGDRESYLDAGFDGYVRKPVDIDTLFAAIARVLGASDGSKRASAAATPAGAENASLPPVIDDARLAELREVLGDDGLSEIVDRLPDECAKALARIKSAIADGDLATARKVAHGLKGVSSDFGAPRLAALARTIELDCPTIAALSDRISELEATIEVTRSGISRVLAESSAVKGAAE